MTFEVRLPRDDSHRAIEITFSGDFPPNVSVDRIRNCLCRTDGISSIRITWPKITITSMRGFGRAFARVCVMNTLYKLGLDLPVEAEKV